MTHELFRRKVILLAVEWAVIILAGVVLDRWHRNLVASLSHRSLLEDDMVLMAPLPIGLTFAWTVAMAYIAIKSLHFVIVGRLRD